MSSPSDNSISKYYRYYDSPDGYDLFHKTEYVCRKIAMGSSTYAIVDILAVTRPKTYFSMAERFLRVFAAPVFAGAIYTTTVYIATNLRKRDDSWNHCFGGFATTFYASRILKNTPMAFILGCPLVFLACIYKDMKMLTGAMYHEDETDNLMKMGTLVIEHDMKNKSMYGNKKSMIYADWFN